MHIFFKKVENWKKEIENKGFLSKNWKLKKKMIGHFVAIIKNRHDRVNQ